MKKICLLENYLLLYTNVSQALRCVPCINFLQRFLSVRVLSEQKDANRVDSWQRVRQGLEGT